MKISSPILYALFVALLCNSSYAHQAESFQEASVEQALNDWKADFPGPWMLRESEWDGRPRLLFGGYIPGGKKDLSDFELSEVAWRTVKTAAAVMNYDSTTLEYARMRRHHLTGRENRIIVGFSQAVNGIVVEGGGVSVVLLQDGGVLAISSSALMVGETNLASIKVSRSAAVEFARSSFSKFFGSSAVEIREAELSIVGPNSSALTVPTVAWRIDLKAEAQNPGNNARRYWVSVDRAIPAIIAEVSLQRNCHEHTSLKSKEFVIDGTLQTRANTGTLPDSVGGLYGFGVSPTTRTLPNARVSFPSGSTVFADQTGFFSDPPNNGNEAPTVALADNPPLGGQTLVQVGGSTYSEVFSAIMGQGNNLTLNAAFGDEDGTAASNAFIAIQDFRSFASSQGDTTLAALDLTARVSYSSLLPGEAEFNLGQTTPEVRFAEFSPGFANMAYSTVVAHEVGHWANAEYGKTGTLGAQTGLDEGFADAWAMYIYGTPLIAENYNGSGSFVRSGNNLVEKCVNPFGCYGDPHINGEPLMGALWKVRENLYSRYSNTVLAEEIFLGIMTDPSVDLFGVEDVIRDWWLIFDDGGSGVFDFSDLTPSFSEINNAFLANGWPVFGLNALTIAHTPLSDFVEDQPSLLVSAVIAREPNFQSASVSQPVVEWRRNGGVLNVTPMTLVGGDFEASLVPIGGGVFDGPDFIEYRISVDYSISTFNFTMVSPFEDFYQVSIGSLKPIYANDFDGGSNQGWTFQENASGLAVDWQRDYAYGQQGTTFGGGVWFDPFTAPIPMVSPGTMVWGTDLGEPGLWNGEYNKNTDSFLLSPVISLPPNTTGAVKVEFSRWLTKGSSSVARVIVEDPSGQALPPLFESSLAETLDLSWRPINLEFIPPVGATGFRLRFELEGGGADNAGGWTIDDLSIFTLGIGPTAGMDTMQLRGNTAITFGDAPVFTVTNASPGDQVHLYFSTNALGSTIMGHTFDLGPGFEFNEVGVSPVVADSSGTAVFPLQPITAGTAGSTIFLEAVVRTPVVKDSNVLPVKLWN